MWTDPRLSVRVVTQMCQDSLHKVFLSYEGSYIMGE